MSTKRDGNISEEEENQLNNAILSSISDGTIQTGRSETFDSTTTTTNNNSNIPPPLHFEKVFSFSSNLFIL